MWGFIPIPGKMATWWGGSSLRRTLSVDHVWSAGERAVATVAVGSSLKSVEIVIDRVETGIDGEPKIFFPLPDVPPGTKGTVTLSKIYPENQPCSPPQPSKLSI